jgi:cytochrome c oxidase subunit II
MWLFAGETMSLSAASLSGNVVNQVFLFMLAICIFLLGLITFLMVYFVIRYRKERNPHPANVEGNFWLELGWTIAPIILVLVMFYYGMTGFEFLKKVPPGALAVKVTARQWSWLFEYDKGVRNSTLRVPVGKPVKLLIRSEDVIHSFFVPAFRIKQDAVPGMTTQLWFQATEAGTFDIFCAQYCGLEHAHMHSRLIALPEEEFGRWYQSRLQDLSGKGLPSGAQLYEVKGCAACHSIDGSPRVGPTFKGLIGKSEMVVRNGVERKVVVNEAFIRNYIRQPNVDVVKGFPPIMPHVDLTESELEAIVKYLATLKG